MDGPRLQRLGGMAGLAFVAASLAVGPLGVLPPPVPVLGASGAEFAAWYSAHRTAFLVVNWLGVAAFGPGLVQLAALVAAIRAREGASGFHSTLVASAGTLTYAVFCCSLIVFQVMPFLLAPHLGAAAEAFGDLTSVWFALDGLAALPMVLAVGAASRATGALPRWFEASCWPVSALLLLMSLGALSAVPGWFAAGGPLTLAGFGAFFAWALALAIAQLRAGRST